MFGRVNTKTYRTIVQYVTTDMIEFIRRVFLGIFLVFFITALGLFWLISPLFIWGKKKKQVKEKKSKTTFDDVFRTIHQN